MYWQREKRRCVIGIERGLVRGLPLDLLGEHDAVLDRHAGALAQVGRRRVRGIAEQHDATAVPGTVEELPFQRPVDHAAVVDDLLAQRGDAGAAARACSRIAAASWPSFRSAGCPALASSRTCTSASDSGTRP